jgi:hypothetical protein
VAYVYRRPRLSWLHRRHQLRPELVALASRVTWSATDKDSSISLSNNNLTATGTTADRSVRATLPAPNGYFEVKADVMGGSSSMAVGLTNLTHIMNIYLGWDQANAIEYRNNGAIVGTNTSTTGVATYTTGDIIGVWFKPDGSVSFYKNGTLQANRTDVPTGSLYPSATIGSSTDQLTANFGATAFNSLPATAIAWNTNAATPNVGASAGTNTATAVGAWLQAGVGSSTGANTSTAVGAWLQSGVGSSAGTDTATATATWLQSGVGSSAGTDTATATGAWLQSGVGSAAGTDTAAATATWLQSGVGNAQGTNTATGVYSAVPSTGTSAGSNTAAAIGHWLQSGVGSSAGADTAAAVGSSTGGPTAVSGDGLAVGANIATAIGHWLQVATGTAIGGNVANGQAPASDFNFDFDASFGGYPGAGTGAGQGDFNTDFNDDFAVFHVGQVASGTGTSVGGNIAEAVGSTIVFIPPVYPPPPPVPVKVWHPAQEYHRVQAPRATRVYRHGTELQRRSPQGMKRRYG